MGLIKGHRSKEYVEFAEREYKKAVSKLNPLGIIKKLLEQIDKEMELFDKQSEKNKAYTFSVGAIGLPKEDNKKREKEENKIDDLKTRKNSLLGMMEEFNGYMSILYLAGVYDVFELLAELKSKNELNEKEIKKAYNLLIEKHPARKSAFVGTFFKFKDTYKEKNNFESGQINQTDAEKIVAVFSKSITNYARLLNDIYGRKSDRKTYENKYDSLEKEIELAYYTGFSDALSCPDVFKFIDTAKNILKAHELADILGTLGSDEVGKSLDEREFDIQEKHNSKGIHEIILYLQRFFTAP